MVHFPLAVHEGENMTRRNSWLVASLVLSAAAGCSWQSGAMTGANLGLNLARKDSHLKISLDGHPARQNTLKKAATGYSEWKVEERIGCCPRLRFQIEEPERFGRITMVAVSVYQQFQADYSHQAEFTITAASSDPAAQLKPDTEYDLGRLPPGFVILDLTGKVVDKVELKPGLKYKLVLTVRADKSETGQVEFKTT
jgi:hypothetical protein